jgi:hypothetical protein
MVEGPFRATQPLVIARAVRTGLICVADLCGEAVYRVGE